MKPLWLFSLIALGLLTGCLTTRLSQQEEAAVVPRLTNTMHVYAIQRNYVGPTNLSPSEIQFLFAEAVKTNPAFKMFENDLKFIRWRDSEIVVLLCNPKTGVACYEDVSCTPNLDRRWYECENPPRTFTLSHPDNCGCK